MLSDAFLHRLDALSLAMRGRARGGAGGSRKSRQLGSSAEFSDYREYIPGDDIRRLDWNALARFDRLFVKLFMEEQESAVTVLLDGSASMAEKWDTARKAAETAAYLALTGGDRVRLYCLREAGNRRSDPLSGRSAFPRVTEFLNSCAPEGAGDPAACAAKITGLRKGLCFLVSDCYSADGMKGLLDLLRYREQECSLIQVLSPFELDPELDGAFRLTDAESGEGLDLLADEGALGAYRRSLDGFLTEIRKTCHSREVPYLLLNSGEDFEKTVIPQMSRSGMI